MARTKASVGAKISSGKSTKARCSAPPPQSNSGSSSERSSRNSYSGGNPWCQREIPAWQKPITNFFKSLNTTKNDLESEETSPSASNSKAKSSKRNVIESDEEEADDVRMETNEPLEVDENSPEKPKNRVLDETIDLEPLTGENSHKMEEYYSVTRINNAGSSREWVDKENLPSSSNNNSMDVSDSNNNNDVNEHKDIKYKGKGIGKKTNKDKVNMNTRKSVKRDLEQVIFGEESQHVKKKIKC